MDHLVTLFSDPAVWAALATLIATEVVLGIDNLIFISILSNKLPEAQRQKARRTGIGLALTGRTRVTPQNSSPSFHFSTIGVGGAPIFAPRPFARSAQRGGSNRVMGA